MCYTSDTKVKVYPRVQVGSVSEMVVLAPTPVSEEPIRRVTRSSNRRDVATLAILNWSKYARSLFRSISLYSRSRYQGIYLTAAMLI